ncbi:spdl-1 [Pristionchus pacificus]|uniref:Spindly n=1 Tax=Pristionchus pacificus TaxID=54126 RepID=A0A8R1V2D3_PRIPA|nr:spdl-1 [Pristionchus pacificus]
MEADMDELTVRNEALVRILREREEQIQQLQLNLRRCESKNAMLEEMAQELEDDSKRIREELAEYKEKVGLRSEGAMRGLRDDMTRLEGELADSNSARRQLQDNVNRLENLLEEERQSRPIEESFHPDTSICTSHEEEIKSLREEIEEAVQWRLEVDTKVKMLERELMESNDRAEDAIHDGNILRKNLEEARDQLKNLECDLNAVKHNTHFASKGNSMFSEFVDERKKLEKELKQLYEENLSLRQENRTLLSEIEELSLQKGKGLEQATRLPCKCSDLQDELYQVRLERDRALQACRISMVTSTDELRKAGMLDATQKKRMGELRDEAKRYYVENDRLRRSVESLKMESMNSKVDKNTWKEKFEAQTREVDRLKDLLNTLRRKHSELSRPSNRVPDEEVVKMCAKPTEVPHTPATASGASVSSRSAAIPSSALKRPLFPPLTPATSSVKRPAHEMNAEKRLEEMNALENSQRAAELSINSSVRRKAPVKKPRFQTNMVKSDDVTEVMKVDGGKKEEIEKIERKSPVRGLRNATPRDESDEKSNCSSNGDKTIEEVKKKEDEIEEKDDEEKMDEGRENHDPSFIMSKERMAADSNLEETVLDETMMIN